jgi:flavorubredoxin
MDHSGSIPLILKDFPNITLITTEKGSKNLKRHFHIDFSIHIVKDGEEFSLGKKTLKFIETPMVHWPESMATYLVQDEILFSMDAFGQHFASLYRFDDEVGWETIYPEAAKYYANIVMPYGKQVINTLNKIKDFKIKIIAPSHGLIWRKYLNEIIKTYITWAKLETKKKALVVYDTMWGTTKKIAHLIGEGINQQGIEVKIFNLTESDLSEIIKESLDARAVIVGSPTLNNGLFPTVASFLTYFKGLRPLGKIGASFGSYGWSGEAVKLIKKELENTKLEVVDEELNIQFTLDKDGEEKCINFGNLIAKKIKD